MSEQALVYDAAGLDASRIGEPLGLSAQDREALDARLIAARDNVLAAHERGELGFLDCTEQDLAPITAWADNVIDSERFTDQVVVGIGGSSLGALAVLASHTGRPLQGLRTHFSENIDPVSFHDLLVTLDLSKTLVIVITKSGSTIETMSKFWILYDRLVLELGRERASEHVIAVTDPERGGLRALVEERGFTSFEVPPNVGGRFSVLTPVGLVPLALAGYDVEALLAGAHATREVATTAAPAENAALRAAGDQVLMLERGVSQVVMMSYADALLPMVDWFRQIWAESLGKRLNRAGEEIFTGITPLKALGVIDQHSQVQLYMEGPADKHVTFLEVRDFGADVTVPTREGLPEGLSHLQGKTLGELLAAELTGTRLALQDAGRPTSRWIFDRVDAYTIGGFILAWEFITAVAGELLDIDAFDQPGVELGKKIAHGLLGRADLTELAEGYSAQDAGNGAGRLGVLDRGH